MKSLLAATHNYRFPDHEISWAGYCPWTEKPCFGTGDGKLILLADADEESKGVLALPIFDDEAVNGVAFSGDHMAISSRNQVRFMPSPLVLNGRLAPQRICQRGAHGIAALASGGFVAPLGHDGLLFIKQNNDQPLMEVNQVTGELFNFYQLTTLEQGSGREVLAAAARSDGLLSLTIQAGSLMTVTRRRANDIDIVGVCSLKSTSLPRAAIALNHDGRVVWMTDVLGKKPPQMIELGGLSGTMDSVFSARGHVFILTDSELITLPHLADQLLSGADMTLPIDATILSIEAVDAFLYGDDEMLVIAGDGVVSFRLDDLVAGTSAHPDATTSNPSQGVSFRPLIFEPEWSISEPAFGDLILV